MGEKERPSSADQLKEVTSRPVGIDWIKTDLCQTINKIDGVDYTKHPKFSEQAKISHIKTKSGNDKWAKKN